MGSSAEPSLRERKKERNRRRIFDSALELFAERSYGEVTIDDICERAEVARATFFRFYGSKTGLLMEFHRRMADAASARIEVTAATSALDRLRQIGLEITAAWRGAPPAMRELFGEFMRTASLAEARDSSQPALQALIADAISDGQRSGELHTSLEPDFAALLMIAILGACVAHWFEHQDPAVLDQTSEAAMQMLLAGLAGT